jgi:hypothetical protein
MQRVSVLGAVLLVTLTCATPIFVTPAFDLLNYAVYS